MQELNGKRVKLKAATAKDYQQIPCASFPPCLPSFLPCPHSHPTLQHLPQLVTHISHVPPPPSPHPHRFITFQEESSVAAVFAAGSMQELNGKRVEVKAATPKGLGPVGRRIARGLLTSPSSHGSSLEPHTTCSPPPPSPHTPPPPHRFITFQVESSVAAVFAAGSMQELNGKRVEVKAAMPRAQA